MNLHIPTSFRLTLRGKLLPICNSMIDFNPNFSGKYWQYLDGMCILPALSVYISSKIHSQIYKIYHDSQLTSDTNTHTKQKNTRKLMEMTPQPVATTEKQYFHDNFIRITQKA